jgi:hypothetical protein
MAQAFSSFVLGHWKRGNSLPRVGTRKADPQWSAGVAQV